MVKKELKHSNDSSITKTVLRDVHDALSEISQCDPPRNLPENMKISSSLGIIAIAFALLPQVASATLLVGLHDFTGNSSTQSITSAPGDTNYALAGFSGSVVKGLASEDSGGASDNLYGSSDLKVLPGTPTIAQTQDGHGKVQELKNIVFSVTNSSGSSITLASLLFDAAYRDVADTTLGVAYQIGTGSIVTLSNDVGPMIKHAQFNNPADYTDFALNLLNVSLGDTETIHFIFSMAKGLAATSNETIRLDNLALTGLSAIPETASVMALALLVGGGLMTRNRRSIAAPTLG